MNAASAGVYLNAITAASGRATCILERIWKGITRVVGEGRRKV
jgi:hypothetical protein